MFLAFAQRCTEVGVAQLGLNELLVAQVKYRLAIANSFELAPGPLSTQCTLLKQMAAKV